MLDDCQYRRVAQSVTANVQQLSANDCFAQNVKECGQCKARQAQIDNNCKISSNLGLCDVRRSFDEESYKQEQDRTRMGG